MKMQVRIPLARKISLLVMGIALSMLAVTTAFLEYGARRDVSERLDRQLAAARGVLSESLRGRSERLGMLCGAIAEAPRFKAAIEEKDSETILEAGRDEMKLVQGHLLLVTDAQGHELARIPPGKSPGQATHRPAIAFALRGAPGADLWVVAGELFQVASRPIRFGQELSGTLTLGSRLDDSVAADMARLTGTQLVFGVEGKPVCSTLASPEARQLLSLPAGDGSGGGVRTERLGATTYRLSPVELGDLSGRPVATCLLLVSLDSALEYLSRIRYALLLAFTLLALIGVGLSMLLARAITTPLAVLMESTAQLAGGDYESSLSVETSDEVGLLAERFETMRASLKSNIARLIEQERLRAEMELDRLRSLSQMVAGVAHEINTPLGIVNQAASILTESLTPRAVKSLAQDEESRALVSDVAEAAQLIQGNIARANTLIASFKNLSVRQVTDRKEKVDLLSLVEEVLGLMKMKARAARLEIAVKCELAPEARSWNGYPGYLSQVLMNLLTNVERYAYPDGQGGRVMVELGAVVENAGSPLPAFRIDVRDFGAGIPAENLTKIFEVFFTTGRGKGGSGLGLAIVHNLVTQALGGTLEVASDPGKQTTFTLTLPAEAPDVQAS